MDRILTLIFDQIALHGYGGASFQILWDFVVKRYPHTFDDAVKSWLWKNIRARPGYEFYAAAPNDAVNPTAKGMSPSQRNPFDPNVDYTAIPPDVLPCVRIVAPEELRYRAMGVKDATLSLSDTQLQILEIVAKKQEAGVLQSRIPVDYLSGETAKTVFFHLKKLESLGLVSRTQTFQRSIKTNLVTLSRFAQQNSARGEDDDEEAENGTQNLSYGTLMTGLFDLLRAAPHHRKREADLAAYVMQCTGRKRRAWQRLREYLQNQGIVACYTAKQKNGQMVRVVELKKNPTRMDTLGIPTASGQPEFLELNREQTIDQQVYNLIVRAGSDGLLQRDVTVRGVRSRLINTKVDQLVQFRGVKNLPENSGKVITYKLVVEMTPEQEEAFERNKEMAQSNTSPGKKVLRLRGRRPPAKKAAPLPEGQQADTSAAEASVADGDENEQSEVSAAPSKVEKRKETLIRSYENGYELYTVCHTGTDTVQPKTISLQANTRLQLLRNEIETKLYVSLVALRNLLRDHEEASTTVDKKTVIRMLDKLIADGLCTVYTVAAPNLTTAGTRRVQIAVHNSVDIDSEEFQDYMKIIRESDSNKNWATASPRKRKTVVALDDDIEATHTDANARVKAATATRRAVDNGYIFAKMIRISQLHTQLASWCFNAPQNDPQEPDVLGVVSRSEFLSQSPLSLYLQLIGITAEHPTLKEHNTTIFSQLPAEIRKLAVDKRLELVSNPMFELLEQLKLVKPIEPRSSHRYQVMKRVQVYDLVTEKGKEYNFNHPVDVQKYWDHLETTCKALYNQQQSIAHNPQAKVPADLVLPESMLKPYNWSGVRSLDVQQRSQLKKYEALITQEIIEQEHPALLLDIAEKEKIPELEVQRWAKKTFEAARRRMYHARKKRERAEKGQVGTSAKRRKAIQVGELKESGYTDQEILIQGRFSGRNSNLRLIHSGGKKKLKGPALTRHRESSEFDTLFLQLIVKMKAEKGYDLEPLHDGIDWAILQAKLHRPVDQLKQRLKSMMMRPHKKTAVSDAITLCKRKKTLSTHEDEVEELAKTDDPHLVSLLSQEPRQLSKDTIERLPKEDVAAWLAGRKLRTTFEPSPPSKEEACYTIIADHIKHIVALPEREYINEAVTRFLGKFDLTQINDTFDALTARNFIARGVYAGVFNARGLRLGQRVQRIFKPELPSMLPRRLQVVAGLAKDLAIKPLNFSPFPSAAPEAETALVLSGLSDGTVAVFSEPPKVPLASSRRVRKVRIRGRQEKKQDELFPLRIPASFYTTNPWERQLLGSPLNEEDWARERVESDALIDARDTPLGDKALELGMSVSFEFFEAAQRAMGTTDEQLTLAKQLLDFIADSMANGCAFTSILNKFWHRMAPMEATAEFDQIDLALTKLVSFDLIKRILLQDVHGYVLSGKFADKWCITPFARLSKGTIIQSGSQEVSLNASQSDAMQVDRPAAASAAVPPAPAEVSPSKSAEKVDEINASAAKFDTIVFAEASENKVFSTWTKLSGDFDQGGVSRLQRLLVGIVAANPGTSQTDLCKEAALYRPVVWEDYIDALQAAGALEIKYGRTKLATVKSLFDEYDGPTEELEFVWAEDYWAHRSKPDPAWTYDRYIWPSTGYLRALERPQ